MLQSTKRSAGKAFEEGNISGPKSHKKRKKSRRDRSDSNTLQLNTANPEEVKAGAINPNSERITRESNLSTASAAELPIENEPTQSTKHKRRRRKSGQNTTQQEDVITLENIHHIPVSAEDGEGGRKSKKKKRHKSKAVGNPSEVLPQLETEGLRPVDSDNVESHLPSAEPQISKKAKKEKRKKKTKSQRFKDTGATKSIEVAAVAQTIGTPDVDSNPPENGTERSASKKGKRSKSKRKVKPFSIEVNEVVHHNEDSPNIPLEHRIEHPPTGDFGVLEGDQEDSEERESDSESDQGIDITGLVPLEDRIEAPARNNVRSRKHKSKRRSEGQSEGEDGQKTTSTRKTGHSKKHPARQLDSESTWSLAVGAGGIFIDHDPLLTPDDQHLILPTKSQVRVYSRSTSLLVRKLQPRLMGDRDQIVSCVQSKSELSQLLVATSLGSVSLWDWTQGEQLGRWKSKGSLEQIVPMTPSPEPHLIMAIHHNDHNEPTLSIRSLDQSSRSQITSADLLKRHGLNANVQLFEDAGVIVATARSRLLLGYCPGFRTQQASSSSFSWREFKVPAGIVTFDARVGNGVRSGGTPRVDIAVGSQTGEILLYEDLLFKLIGMEKKNNRVDISARILHWHRNAVNTVKWSQDANYLISGGRETVLVIWQLDTNQQQHLPHLSSEILNLSVSAKGSSYALRLADNSVMVLSSANLDATTNIPGFAAVQDPRAPLAVSLHPTSPDRLLVAVPRDSSQKDQSAFALQTYDLNTDRELGRQALTRNTTTVVTTELNGSPVVEPNVTHLRLSADGKWLATVETWCADPRDLDGVTLTGEDDFEELGAETCLKVWLYNEQHGDWELVNRIDNPHSRGSTEVLALQSSPSRNEFATAGSDGKVRIWRPRARVRDGVPVRNETGEQLYSWGQMSIVSCVTEIRTESEGPLTFAALAYSPDGTVIAVSWSQSKSGPRWTYLLHNEQGKICLSVPDLATNGPCSMAFSNRYLISLSDTLCIYDTVNGVLVSKTDLEQKYQGPHNHRHLAVNVLDGTVAMAVNPTQGKMPGHLAVIDIIAVDRRPLFEQEIPGQVHALLGSASMHGFVLVDGHSNIRHVRRTGGQTGLSLISTAGAEKESEDVRKGLDRIFGQAQPDQRNGDFSGVSATGRLLMNGEEQAARRTLEDVLNFQTSAQAPPVGELFDRIAGLFASPAVGA